MKFKITLFLFALLYSSKAVPEDHSWAAFEVPTRQFQCLVRTLYHEARGEPVEGVLAVAQVVLNRTEHDRYPDSICKVVKQQLVKGVYQFSFWKHKEILKKPVNKTSWRKMEILAQQAINLHYSGFDIADKAMYYHTTKVKPSWRKSDKLKRVKKIGNHIFYKRVKD